MAFSANPFPTFLRRLDPLLEAGSENHLYLLFRERRSTVRGFRYFNQTLWLMNVVMILMILDILPGKEYIVAYSFVVVGFVLLTAAKRKGRIAQYLAQIVMMPMENRKALTDLWMTECNGRLLLEATYLEQRAGTHNLLKIVAALLVPGAIFYFARVGTGAYQVAACVGVMVSIATLALCYLRGCGMLSYRRLGRNVASIWADPGFKSRFKMGLVSIPYVLAIQAVTISFIAGASYGFMALVIVSLVVTLGAWVVILVHRSPTKDQLAEINERANDALDHLIRVRLAEAEI